MQDFYHRKLLFSLQVLADCISCTLSTIVVVSWLVGSAPCWDAQSQEYSKSASCCFTNSLAMLPTSNSDKYMNVWMNCSSNPGLVSVTQHQATLSQILQKQELTPTWQTIPRALKRPLDTICRPRTWGRTILISWWRLAVEQFFRPVLWWGASQVCLSAAVVATARYGTCVRWPVPTEMVQTALYWVIMRWKCNHQNWHKKIRRVMPLVPEHSYQHGLKSTLGHFLNRCIM